MDKLLRIEWMKIKNYRTFIILGLFFVLGVVTTNYIVYSVNKNVVGEINTAGLVPSFNPYSFDNTWQTTSYVTGFLLVLPVLLLIILITNEYTFRTNRQNIIDGLSRQQFISVKLMMALIMAVVCTLLVILTGLTFAAFSGSSFSLNRFSHVGFFFLKSLSYFMLAVMLSVWVRRTGFAIGIFFIYMGAENIISQLLDVWSMKIKRDSGLDLGSMGDYLPMNASDGLLTFPDNPLKTITKSVMPTEYTWLILILAIAYLAGFIIFSRKLFIKRDL